MIQSLPILDLLKRNYPDCQIDWVVEKSSAPLLSAHPSIHSVIEIDTKKWRRKLSEKNSWREIFHSFKKLRLKKYDLIFDLQGNCKSALFTLFARGKSKIGFSWQSVPEKINFFFTNKHVKIAKNIPIQLRYLRLIEPFVSTAEIPSSKISFHLSAQDKQKIDAIIHSISLSPIFMICFGSKWINKQLPDSTLIQFLAMVEHVYAPYFLFVYGNEEEKMRAKIFEENFLNRSKVIGEMSLPFWQRLIARVDCLIAMDSAALHLCGTTNTPSFTIFGPSSSSIYKPIGEKHLAYQGSCPYQVEFEKRCPHLRSCKTGACIKTVSAGELFHSFHQFWLQIGERSPLLSL